MGKYDGIQWRDLVKFQTSGTPGNDGLSRETTEEKLLAWASSFSQDAGFFASRAQRYFHKVRGLPWAGDTQPEQLLSEMRQCLAYFLGHLINAANHLDADVLAEFARWSEEIGATLPRTPYRPPAAAETEKPAAGKQTALTDR